MDQSKIMGAHSSRSPPQSRMTFITFVALLLLMLAITTWMILPYLLAVTTGGILALLSYPLFQRLQHCHLKPKIASLTTTIGIILLVIVPLIIFVTMAIRQG